jgi:hypothetical protein
VEADQVREFLPAGLAPRSPEIDHQNPASLLSPQPVPSVFIQINNSPGRRRFGRNHGVRTACAEKQSGYSESPKQPDFAIQGAIHSNPL